MTAAELADLKAPAIPADFALKKWGPGTVVGMNQSIEVDATARIYTVGLGGCRATIAVRGDRVQLAHFSPLAKDWHNSVLRSFRPQKVALWVPGDWRKNADGRWVMEPTELFEEFAWACPVTRAYSLVRDFDEGVSPCLEFNAGKVFHNGSPVAKPFDAPHE